MAASNPDLTPAATALNSGAIHLLRAMRLIDRESGLTAARLSALSVLLFGGPCTLGELARAEDVSGPTMTRIVDGLTADGLVQRQAHPEDGRAVRVVATAQGEALMRAAAGRRIAAIVAALGELSAADRRALVRAAPLLDRVATAVRRAGW
jgi:DNA-binding MarR family transcriptional regulator